MSNTGSAWMPQIAKLVVELTAARKLQGLTTYELCEKTGLARRSLQNWERGDCQPHLDRLERWAAGLGYTMKIDIE